VEDELARRATAGEGITFADMAWVLRTERLTGDTAGYGQIVPLRPVSPGELRVLWHAPVGPIAAPLTPFALGVRSVPPELGRHRYLGEGEAASFVDDRDPDDRASLVPQRIEATRSAVAIHKRLLYLLAEHHEVFLPEVVPVWEAFERDQLELLADVMETAGALIDGDRLDLALDLVTRHCGAQAIRALDLAETMVDSMDARSRLLFGIREDRGWRGPEQIW
jgi:dipeptidase